MWRIIVITFVVTIYSSVHGNARQAENVDNRIVNGTNAESGEFPFVASLRRVVNVTGGSHSCGSSIISHRWILTAAHCVIGREPSSINIQYGVTEIVSAGPNVVTAKDIIVHHDYNPQDSYINDIALVELSVPLRFDDITSSVKLPHQGQITTGGSKAMLVGWGLNATGGSIQKHLQKVNIQTFSDEDCRRLHNKTVHYTNICAGIEGGGKGQCNGDSGGPLIVDGVQVGIVSWSIKPCTVAPYPGVFTKVAEYVDWIRKNAVPLDDTK